MVEARKKKTGLILNFPPLQELASGWRSGSGVEEGGREGKEGERWSKKRKESPWRGRRKPKLSWEKETWGCWKAPQHSMGFIGFLRWRGGRRRGGGGGGDAGRWGGGLLEKYKTGGNKNVRTSEIPPQLCNTTVVLTQIYNQEKTSGKRGGGGGRRSGIIWRRRWEESLIREGGRLQTSGPPASQDWQKPPTEEGRRADVFWREKEEKRNRFICRRWCHQVVSVYPG